LPGNSRRPLTAAKCHIDMTNWEGVKVGNLKQRVKYFEKRLDLDRGRRYELIKIPPPPPAINPIAIERSGDFPRRPGETDQEYLDRYNYPGPEGWIYTEYTDHGNYAIAFPVRSNGRE